MFLSNQWFELFTLVLARVGGMVMTAPIYGTVAVPGRVRMLLAVALSLLISPVLGVESAARIGGTAQYFILLGGEAVVGACIGLGILVLVHGLTMAGALISQSAGLGMAETFDPAQGENSPYFSQMLFMTGICVFFLIGGHRVATAGLLDSFRAIPPGSGALPDSLAEGFSTLAAQSFSLAVRAAAPALAALILATLILGLIGRTLPQLNVLALGFGANSLLAFATGAVTFGIVVWAFADQIALALELIFDSLKTPLRMEWLA